MVISFSDTDFDGVQTPHDDTMVITLTTVNFKVKSVLVDNGNSANIMYYSIFEKMKLGDDSLIPMDSPLYGFSGEPIRVKGAIELPVTAGTTPRQSTIMVRFLVIKLPSAYNLVLGRQNLNTLGAFVSAPHMKMKFPTASGVGEVRGD
ncbi:hypothetical protein CFOL_v3_29322 [Cephalotus follicularis]|uniref:RVP_2 domain-containing protein n=1 Tax=Cephalotus follicularis TaxID=3775 RepID=A0A1Q3D0Q6_CEPFO|nr:hypothetical protein CFOL_v3_29322 [Cephalotus follicularis]